MKNRLKDSSLFRQAAYIDGSWDLTSASKRIEVLNPATAEIIGEVPISSAADTRRAIAAAQVAFDSWKCTTAKHRSAILRKFYELVMENQQDLALIMTLEQGRPINEAQGEIAYGANYIEWFAEEAKRSYGDIIPTHRAEVRHLVVKEPVGVVATITPWNFPSAMLARKVAPALAAGCTVVSKPSELTPFSALALAVLAERAGLPKGVWNIINGEPTEVGTELTTNTAVKKVSFTGSTRASVDKVAAHVADAVAQGGKIICGGQAKNGLFFEPTVIAGATSAMLLASEETFGPLAALFPFSNEADVIKLANDTDFGLAAYFYSRDHMQIWRVAESLEAGMVGVNEGILSSELIPFGGIKQSGFGREGSKYGLDDYQQLKYICMGGLS
ncbi:UNVERIFIED_CONTAM: hypothetical protein GTU68_040390 [Idotea baltica]|nr:hypothetical protein [Idotea baltica]